MLELSLTNKLIVLIFNAIILNFNLKYLISDKLSKDDLCKIILDSFILYIILLLFCIPIHSASSLLGFVAFVIILLFYWLYLKIPFSYSLILLIVIATTYITSELIAFLIMPPSATIHTVSTLYLIKLSILDFIISVSLISILRRIKFFKNKIHSLNFNVSTRKISYKAYLPLLISYSLLFLCIIILTSYFSISDFKLLQRVNSIIFITIIIIIATTLYYFFYHNSTNKLYLKKKNEEYEELKVYTSIIEDLSKDLRKERHDYANVLLALRGFIDENDMDGIKHYFYEHILKNQHQLDKHSSIFLSLQNLKDLGLKGLISTKLNNALSCDLNASVNILSKIDTIPIESIDLYKIFGILLDNALEAAKESEDKFLNITAFKDDDAITFTISNSYKEAPELDRIFEKGFSTKGEGRGIGLSTVKDIMDNKYKKAQLESFFEGERVFFELTMDN